MLTMNTALYVSESNGEIEIAAPAGSDFFIDPMTGVEKHDAPFCYEKVKGDFAIRARVKPDFQKTYDAGGLFEYDTARKWIKLEFEKTDPGCPSVVSVVTSGFSMSKQLSCSMALSRAMTSGIFPGCLAKSIGSLSLTEYRVNNLMVSRPSRSLLKPRRASF